MAYADCGTGGLLDAMLAEEGVERLPGAHCYEFYAGAAAFAALADEELGTFFLTDFLARNFDRLVIKGLGLDRHPELLPTSTSATTRRLVYLAQTDDPALVAAARRGAPAARSRLRGATDRLRRPGDVPGRGRGPDPGRRPHPTRSRSRLTCPPCSRSIWWRDIPAQVVARDGRRSSKVVLHPRFQVAIDKAANRAGMREYNDYIGEWRKTIEPCGDDLEAEVTAESERLEAEYTKHHLAELIQSGGVAGGPALPPGDHSGDLSDMTDTVLSSATREVVIGFDRPFVIIGERINPTGRKAARRGDEGRRLQPRRARRAGPGRGRRPHARRQRRHPARRRAGDPGPDHPARPEPDRPAAVDRLVDRRGARGRARRLPGQGAASTR